MTESLSGCSYVLFSQTNLPLQVMKNPCFFNSLLHSIRPLPCRHTLRPRHALNQFVSLPFQAAGGVIAPAPKLGILHQFIGRYLPERLARRPPSFLALPFHLR